MFYELAEQEILSIDGGWSIGQTLQVAGGVICIAGGVAYSVSTGGFGGALGGAAGVASGIGLIGSAFS